MRAELAPALVPGRGRPCDWGWGRGPPLTLSPPMRATVCLVKISIKAINFSSTLSSSALGSCSPTSATSSFAAMLAISPSSFLALA